MNQAYKDSNKRLAGVIVKMDSVHEVYAELAKYGDRHPQLRNDVSREIMAIYKETFPDIKPPDMLRTARQYVDEYAHFSPDKRDECMNRTRLRDPICHGLMLLVLEEKFKKAATEPPAPPKAEKAPKKVKGAK